MVGVSGTYSSLFVAQPLKAASQPNNALQQAKSNSNTEELTEEEQKQVQELKARDQEVRAHEQAHATVGGPYAGQPTYEYQEGPDGRRYAVGGEVQIDASAVSGNPDATIRKMDIVIRAALAPAEPSPQDRQVAQQAQATRLQAQIEKREVQEQEQAQQNGDTSIVTSSNPLEALINAALDFTQLQQEENNTNSQSTALLNEAISVYTTAAALA
jgi:hypothetical protein